MRYIGTVGIGEWWWGGGGCSDVAYQIIKTYVYDTWMPLFLLLQDFLIFIGFGLEYLFFVLP